MSTFCCPLLEFWGGELRPTLCRSSGQHFAAPSWIPRKGEPSPTYVVLARILLLVGVRGRETQVHLLLEFTNVHILLLLVEVLGRESLVHLLLEFNTVHI